MVSTLHKQITLGWSILHNDISMRIFRTNFRTYRRVDGGSWPTAVIVLWKCHSYKFLIAFMHPYPYFIFPAKLLLYICIHHFSPDLYSIPSSVRPSIHGSALKHIDSLIWSRQSEISLWQWSRQSEIVVICTGKGWICALRRGPNPKKRSRKGKAC